MFAFAFTKIERFGWQRYFKSHHNHNGDVTIVFGC